MEYWDEKNLTSVNFFVKVVQNKLNLKLKIIDSSDNFFTFLQLHEKFMYLQQHKRIIKRLICLVEAKYFSSLTRVMI